MAFVPTQSYVTIFEQVDRIEHLDAEGGGEITRTFYCEPYTAHQSVCTALKGTVVDSGIQDSNGNEIWNRIKPHSDPLYTDPSGNPVYYCNEIKVIPANRQAITGCRSTGFQKINVTGTWYGPWNTATDWKTQLTALQTAANNTEDFDYGNIIDFAGQPQLGISGVKQGYSGYSGAYSSLGKGGAYITATYRPLNTISGLSTSPGPYPSAQDPFDFINPQLIPATKATQMGRSLRVIAPNVGRMIDLSLFGNPTGPGGPLQNGDYSFLGVNLTAPAISGGVTESATVPEEFWTFKVTRRLVPFLPRQTITLLCNTINQNAFTIGTATAGYNFPPGTVRMDSCLPTICRSPDGQIYYDLDLQFSIRTTYALCFFYKDGVHVDNTYKNDWVTWNHGLANPTSLVFGVDTGINCTFAPICYYPIGWYDGCMNMYGNFRGIYLFDNTVNTLVDFNNTALPILGTGNQFPMMGNGNNGWSDNTLNLAVHPFSSGWILGQ